MISAINMALSAEEPTLWQEIWEYIKQSVTASDNYYYENLNLGTNPMATVRMMIFGLMIGVIIASVVIIFDKRVLGEFIRKLLSQECLSRESAKRLCDLGFDRKYVIRNGVRRGTNIRCVVRCREEEEYNEQIARQKEEYEKKREEDPSLPPFIEVPYVVNADADHFYIPEEKKYTAEMRFDKRGTTWLGLITVILAAIIIFFLLMAVTPEILKLLDEMAGGAKMGSGNILT